MKKLQKEVEKMAKMMQSVENEFNDDDENKDEDVEDEEPEESEESEAESEESESEESESDTESQSEAEVSSLSRTNSIFTRHTDNLESQYRRMLKIKRRKITWIHA